MKQSILKRTLLTACLGASMAGVAMAGARGARVIFPTPGGGVFYHRPGIDFSSRGCGCYQPWS